MLLMNVRKAGNENAQKDTCCTCPGCCGNVSVSVICEVYRMRKRTKGVIWICVLIFALGIGSECLFWSYRMGRIDRVFDGSRVGNSDGYCLDFSYMDKSDSQTMHLESGDTLKVTYKVRDGRVDVTIGISDRELIYRGNDVQTEAFELPIQEAGEYVISVNASKASGRLEFEKNQ